MMSIACSNLDLGRTGLDLVACGCSSSVKFDRSCVRNYSNINSKGSSRVYGVRRLVSSRFDRARSVASMKAVETLLEDAAQGPPPVLDVKEQRRPISLTNSF